MTIGMQTDIVLEMVPELLQVSGPEGSQQTLLLEDGIAGIGALRQLSHQEALNKALITAKGVGIVHHVGNEATLGILCETLGMSDKHLGLLSPVLIE